MARPEPVKIVGYCDGIPVTRITKYGGGMFVYLYTDDLIYSRAVYRGGGARGSREEEAEFLASLDPIREDGDWWLSVRHQVTTLVGASLSAFREALAQVDDERAPRLEGETLDTLAKPNLWCDEWEDLWHRAKSSAKLVMTRQLEADVPGEVREALISKECEHCLRPDPTIDVTVALPSNLRFAMGLQPDGQFMYSPRMPAAHLPVLPKGLPMERFIAGLLELRTRILDSDCYARDLLAAATGRTTDTSALLEAEEGDMIAALLAIRATGRRSALAAARLKEFGSPWGEYAENLDLNR